MFDFSNFFAFLLMALLIEATPGPNMSYLAIVTLGQGRSAGFRVIGGIATGLLIVGVLASLGLSQLLSSNPMVYQFLRWGGIAYILWLAYESFAEASKIGASKIGASKTSSTKKNTPHKDAIAYFRDGLITNLLNPKAYLFYMATLPEFITAGDNIRNQSLVLTSIYVGVATCVHILIVLMADRAQKLIKSDIPIKRIKQWLSLALVGVALWLVFSTHS